MKRAIRFCPTIAVMRSATPGGKPMFVETMPSGGRPIRPPVNRTIFSVNVTFPIAPLNRAVYINGTIYGGKAMTNAESEWVRRMAEHEEANGDPDISAGRLAEIAAQAPIDDTALSWLRQDQARSYSRGVVSALVARVDVDCEVARADRNVVVAALRLAQHILTKPHTREQHEQASKLVALTIENEEGR